MALNTLGLQWKAVKMYVKNRRRVFLIRFNSAQRKKNLDQILDNTRHGDALQPNQADRIRSAANRAEHFPSIAFQDNYLSQQGIRASTRHPEE